ncbi:MAG: tRNA (adenosine(37)-N6)-threonylcarbamoyltransferase complex dimerization subunit type 1 TsaB [Elusimicrobiota bacterium]|jgi:tRNA threonylcarbamoyladenosine biosynthesis protein TsaB
MIVLAVDTTGERLSFALGRGDGRPPLTRSSFSKRPHDERLFEEAGRLLRAAGLERGDLDALVAASGPGRFTGIRVGLTFATMLASALGVPAVAVTLFEALAHREALAGGAGRVCVVLPAFRGELFLQEFVLARGKAKPAAPPRWIDAASAGKAEAEAGRRARLLRGEVRAADLLGPALVRLGGRRRSPALPLYLKPANFQRPA